MAFDVTLRVPAGFGPTLERMLARDCGHFHTTGYESSLGADREDREIRAQAEADLFLALGRGADELIVPGWLVPTVAEMLRSTLDAALDARAYDNATNVLSLLAQVAPVPISR